MLIKDIPYTIANGDICAFIDGLLFQIDLNEELNPQEWLHYDGVEFSKDEAIFYVVRIQVGNEYPTIAQIYDALTDDWLLHGEREKYIAEGNEEQDHTNEISSPRLTGRI